MTRLLTIELSQWSRAAVEKIVENFVGGEDRPAFQVAFEACPDHHLALVVKAAQYARGWAQKKKEKEEKGDHSTEALRWTPSRVLNGLQGTLSSAAASTDDVVAPLALVDKRIRPLVYLPLHAEVIQFCDLCAETGSMGLVVGKPFSGRLSALEMWAQMNGRKTVVVALTNSTQMEYLMVNAPPLHATQHPVLPNFNITARAQLSISQHA